MYKQDPEYEKFMKNYQNTGNKRAFQDPEDEQIVSATAMINEVNLEETDNIVKRKKISNIEEVNSPKQYLH